LGHEGGKKKKKQKRHREEGGLIGCFRLPGDFHPWKGSKKNVGRREQGKREKGRKLSKQKEGIKKRESGVHATNCYWKVDDPLEGEGGRKVRSITSPKKGSL